METKSSPYLLIFRDSSPEKYREMSPQQRQELLQEWNDWYDRLASQGRLEQGRPLEPTGRVVSGAEGRVMDGPFAEAKEAIGGYFLLKVASLDEATEIARQCPGLPYGIVVEVRPAAECCPILGREKALERTLAGV